VATVTDCTNAALTASSLGLSRADSYGIGMLSLASALLWAACSPASDTVNVAVGSPLINWRLEQPYASKFEIWQVTGADSTRLVAGTNVVTHKNGEMLVHADAPPAPAETMVFDLHTLAFNHDTSAFNGSTADIVVEFLPRRLGVVYRVRLRFDPNAAPDVHLYQTCGQENGMWVVEDHSAASGKLASRLWLVDKPPYMIRWMFYDAPKPGSEVHAHQALAARPAAGP
jgi:hypothetical protein